MQLSPHFSLAEFTVTQHREIDNTLPPDLYNEARRTCQLLERVRDFLSNKLGREVPLTLSSGYRCLELNRAVGSADSSDHIKAMAADMVAPVFGTPLKIASTLAPYVDQLGVGQLIHEYGRWVHLSTRTPDKTLNRIITISGAGTFVGVLPC